MGFGEGACEVRPHGEQETVLEGGDFWEALRASEELVRGGWEGTSWGDIKDFRV